MLEAWHQGYAQPYATYATGCVGNVKVIMGRYAPNKKRNERPRGTEGECDETFDQFNCEGGRDAKIKREQVRMRQACTCIERNWKAWACFLMPVVSTGHDTAEGAREGRCAKVDMPRLTKKVTSNLPRRSELPIHTHSLPINQRCSLSDDKHGSRGVGIRMSIARTEY